MKVQAFNAKCPLEVGDKVIIRNEAKGMAAYYTPENLKAPAELLESGTECIITDIAVIHFFREGKIQFRYELNKSGTYEPLIVKMPVKMLSTAENNARVMKECMKEARDAAEFLKDEKNDIEEWQIAGINAMFDQCNKESIVPYDMPTAIKGLLCMQYQ